MADHSKAPASKAKTAANAIIVAVAICAGIVGVNIVASRVFGRADLTEDRIYSLSDASRKMVAELPDRMTVRAYISSGLQPPLNQYSRYLRDVLDEYATASKGKLQWEAIDPLDGSIDEKNQKKEELSKYRIQKITLERISEAKLEIGSDNYLGVGFQYGGETESIPQITSTEGLEYQITAIIKKLTSAKKKKVGFATTEGELQPQQGLQILSRVLQDYETPQVPLDKPLPEDLDALVVIGPKQPFKAEAKRAIDGLLMKGKSVAFFVDGMVIDTPNGMNIPGMDQPKMARPNDVALADLLEKYGVKVRDDLILDEQNAPGIVPVNGQMFLRNHPVFVGVPQKEGGLAEKTPLTDHVNVLIMPFASSVELVGPLKDGKGEGVTVTRIAQSSLKSWRQTGFYMFNPTVDPAKSAEVGRFPLGYAIEGKIKSAFAGAAESSAAATPAESPAGTRLLVFGDADMFSDEYVRAVQQIPFYRSNLLFFINSIDWLLHDESLIALRAKGMSARPLTVTYDGTVRTMVIFNVVGIPVLWIAFGLVLWRLRVARRRRVKL